MFSKEHLAMDRVDVDMPVAVLQLPKRAGPTEKGKRHKTTVKQKKRK